MASSRLTAFTAGAVFAVVVGGGTAFAATGGDFVLGRSNTAGATTSLTNPNGPALSLRSGRGPALKVDNGRKVANLNADKLDGFTVANIGWTGGYDVPGELVDLDENGVADSVLAVAECPFGTEMTGGGSANFTSGVTIYDAPLAFEGWGVIVSVPEGGTDDPADVIASVVCYSPTGAGLDDSYRATAGSAGDWLLARARAHLAD